VGVVSIGGKLVGDGNPCFVCFDGGVNHNGSVKMAKTLVDIAVAAGADAVKWQKRDPLTQVPPAKRDVMRDTPWGEMPTLEYRQRVEFGEREYDQIDEHCRASGIMWFASAWDEPSVDFLERYNPPAHKVASATLRDKPLLVAMRATGRPIIMSTGLSDLDDVRRAVDVVGDNNLVLLACVSDYPTRDEDMNLRVIDTLREEFTGVPVGLSSHELGVLPSLVSVCAFNADMVERHITINRALPGSDQGISLEPRGAELLVRDIRRAEALIKSDGIKRITEGEQKQIARLRL
jgi:N-acetylneuraminate synthase